MNVIKYENIGTLKDGEVFEWNIPGWILSHKYSTKRSDLFSHTRIPEFKFCLTLRPYTDASAKSVSFNLQLHSIPVFDVGKDSPTETFKHVLPEMDVRFILYKRYAMYRWSCSMKMEENRLTADFPDITPDDSLTIQCLMLTNVSTVEASPIKSDKIRENSPELAEESSILIRDMEEMLNSGKLSDAALSVGDKEFRVHRCILTSRSNVFAAMFKHDTREKQQNRIVIEDFPHEIIWCILKYIYTEKIDELSPEEYLSLYIAADKYAILDLRRKCSQSLQTNLPFNCVIPVLVAADLHHDDDLKNAAMQVFLNKAVLVMESEDWLSFLKDHTELANSVLMLLAKNSSPRSTD